MNKLLHRPMITLGALLLFAFLVRLPYPLTGTVPFGFDHGRDALAAMDIIVNHKLRFVGPWTSIPGLFFGPTWYYLIAFCLWVGRFSPVAPTYGMIVLVLVQIVIAWKYFGKIEAVMVASATFWLTISQSAWNPFPITLISWMMLVLLKKIGNAGKISVKQVFYLGILSSLATHFSSAFAVFYPIIIGWSLFRGRVKLKIVHVFLAFVGFVIPFIPQILFELKNDFIQTRSVITYFSKGGEAGDALSLSKIGTITLSSLAEIRYAIMPEFRTPWAWVNDISRYWFTSLLIACVIYVVYSLKKSTARCTQFVATLLGFVLIPIIGFWFLHYNYWYLTGMMPAAVILGSSIIRRSPVIWRTIFVVSLLLTPLMQGALFYYSNNQQLSASHAFLPVKQKAVSFIRESAGVRPFSVYVYASDIYDFPYQFIWTAQAYSNLLPLPVEYAYESGVPTYVPEKERILAHIESSLRTKSPAQVTYFVVEKPQYPKNLWQWWMNQQYDPKKISLVAEYGNNLKIYEYNTPQ